MLMKSRRKPLELQIMQSLRGRVVFSEKEELSFKYRVAGDVGECLLDESAEGVDGCVVRINDLVVSRDRACQIDTLFVGARQIYLLDAKHWNGAYTVGPNGFSDLTHDPLHQLQRAQRMVEDILRRMRISIPVEARLVFTNPNVTLYGLTPEMPILLPHQIAGYFDRIRQKEGPVTDWQVQLAKRILQCHSEENPYRKVMAYDRSTVRPGILCRDCRVAMREHNLVKLGCPGCGMVELKVTGLERAKEELDILFPNAKPPVDQLHKWCDGLISKRTLHRFLCQGNRKA